MRHKNYVFLTAFLLTTIIFFLGYLLSYGMDFLRIREVVNTIQNYEINSQSYVIENDLVQTMGGDKCEMLNNRIRALRTEIQDVGSDLTKYGVKSVLNKKDFDYLKRRYFLLELEFYNLVNSLNHECGKQYFPVILFYKIDDEQSQQQGFVLDDLGREYRNQVVILSFDGEYQDEKTVQILKSQFNVTTYPTTIVDTTVLDHIVYTTELNRTILSVLYDDGIDKYAPSDFSSIFSATKVNMSSYEKAVLKLVNNQSLDAFTKGDLLLVLGRLTSDNNTKCLAMRYFDNISEGNPIRKALAYESIASIGCGRDKKNFYLAASRIWLAAGNAFRAEIDRQLALQMQIETNATEFREQSNITIQPHPEVKEIILGDDSLLMNNQTVVAQVDRVTRDWLGLQYQDPYSPRILTTFSERLTYNESELLADIGWHEGGRLKDMGITPDLAAGSLVQRIGDRWFAFNLDGTERFEVPIDKVMYPTTRFLRPDLAVVIDTHGINMLVERAELMNATVVVGCCDHPGKIAATRYLSNRNITVLCFTDKYLPLLINQGIKALGSPPVTNHSGAISVGNQEIHITSDDVILAMNISSDAYATSYYETPTRYFERFKSAYPLFDVRFFTLTDFGQMRYFIARAEALNATVIAIRVFNSDDYQYAHEWLSKDRHRRAILFHSTPYPYGVKLMREFPRQSTFDDINID